MMRFTISEWPNETPAERGKANRWIAGAALLVPILLLILWSEFAW